MLYKLFNTVPEQKVAASKRIPVETVTGRLKEYLMIKIWLITF